MFFAKSNSIEKKRTRSSCRPGACLPSPATTPFEPTSFAPYCEELTTTALVCECLSISDVALDGIAMSVTADTVSSLCSSMGNFQSKVSVW